MSISADISTVQLRFPDELQTYYIDISRGGGGRGEFSGGERGSAHFKPRWHYRLVGNSFIIF